MAAAATSGSNQQQRQRSRGGPLPVAIAVRWSATRLHDPLRFVHKGSGMAGGKPDIKGRQGLATLDIGFATGGKGGMNEPEVTMLDATHPSNLIVTSTAVTAAGKAIALVMHVPAPLRALADQVVRSASSVPANLSEGRGRSGRDRLYHWRIAYGSAKEVDSHLRLLVHAGAVDAESAEVALGLFDQVRAMTWRLLHPKA